MIQTVVVVAESTGSHSSTEGKDLRPPVDRDPVLLLELMAEGLLRLPPAPSPREGRAAQGHQNWTARSRNVRVHV